MKGVTQITGDDEQNRDSSVNQSYKAIVPSLIYLFIQTNKRQTRESDYSRENDEDGRAGDSGDVTVEEDGDMGVNGKSVGAVDVGDASSLPWSCEDVWANLMLLVTRDADAM